MYEFYKHAFPGFPRILETHGNGLSMENQGNLREFVKLLREF